MAGWGEYAAAWLVFLLSHMLPARPRLRRRLVAVLGERGYLLGYSAMSLIVLAWLIAAAGRAPHVPLWGWAAWQAWVPNLLVPAGCMLVALGVGVPNPFSIAGAAAARFDPSRPGVLAVTRHPVLWGMVAWAAAHVLPNGDLAHVLLFGAFAAFALVGMRIVAARRRRVADPDWWAAAMRVTGRGAAGLSAIATSGTAMRAAAGLGSWLILLLLHAPVLGVSPLPTVP